MLNIKKEVEKLIQFALSKSLIEKWDIVQVRNQILDLLKIDEPYEGKLSLEAIESPVEILNNILDYAAEQELIEANTTTYRDLLDAKIMGILMPRQSEMIRKFYSISDTEGIEKATDWYYEMSQNSNYIRMDRIAKNLYWKYPSEYGDIEITVNLSKPEKDPKAIAAARNMKQSNYPKCFLCLENVGYQGRVNHPARQNHRVIPVDLSNEQWYVQYSPYVYYNEHCIVFYEEHSPMSISPKTFKRLLEFTKNLPHYFVGSNADLPIVGGSILSHDHFQGGHHQFAMALAPIDKKFKHLEYKDLKIGIVKWPMSVIRISGNDIDDIVALGTEILSKWRNYSDESVDVLAYTEDTPHNTITPIARKNAQGEFELDLVLRNNGTTEEYPDGIYHPHKELHHIKKENIGLIEVMGLAVLPGRLDTELSVIKDILTGKIEYNSEIIKEDEMLAKHHEWINKMILENGLSLCEEIADDLLKRETGKIFTEVLTHAGVYKRNDKGQAAFVKFINEIGAK